MKHYQHIYLFLCGVFAVTGARPLDPSRVRREVLILTDGHSSCQSDTPQSVQEAAERLQVHVHCSL